MGMLFLVVVGGALWLGASYLLVVWVVVPLIGLTAVAGAGLGALVALVEVARVLAARGPHRPKLLSSDDVRDTRRFRPVRSAYGRDPGWPHYLARQGWVDLDSTARAVWARIVACWTWTAGVAMMLPLPWLWLPPAVLPLLALTVASVSALLTLGAALALMGAALVVAAAGWSVVGVTLRGVDAGVRRLRRAAGSCAICYHVTSLPSYPCGCGRIHRDLRPGLLGVLTRRCACGAAIPTTVLRAGAGRTALCPACDEPLQQGAGVLTDVRLPVFGPVSAGKTTLLFAGLLGLQEHLTRHGGTLQPVGARSEQEFETGAAGIRAGDPTIKTPASTPVALTVRVTCGRRAALLHGFDAAGELFAERVTNRDLRFLDHASGLAFVVDPFSIPAVDDAVRRRHRHRRIEAAPAETAPEDAYHVTVQQLRDQGVGLDRQALAVVVVKADLLLDLPVGAGLVSDTAAVRAWLLSLDQYGLVTAAERDFAEVRYFLVSSAFGWRDGHVHGAAAPLLWLGARAGLPLPATERKGLPA